MNLRKTEMASAGIAAVLPLIRRQVESLEFGTVEIVIHDGRITQIDKTERIRLGHPLKESAPFGSNNKTTN